MARRSFPNFVSMHQLLYINWDPEPTFLYGYMSWYGLLFAGSFLVGYWIMSKIFKKEGIDSHYLENLTLYMGLSTVIGARLGHCLFYDPGYYLSHPLEILLIYKGGLASHGAAIGIITGLLLWSRFVSKRSVLWVLDRIVIMVALSGLFIRTGNLINSEILGDPTEASVGVVFPKADQSEYFRAKYVGNDVEVSCVPFRAESPYFSLFRFGADSSLVEIQGPLVKADLNGRPGYKGIDRNAGKSAKHYWALARGRTQVSMVAPVDSNDTREIALEHEFMPTNAQFLGRWEAGKVRLHFEMRGLGPETVKALVLMGSTDGKAWELVGRGTLSGTTASPSFDTLVALPPGITKMTYRILEKDQEILLVARHASMMYEAFFYTIVFAFLLWSYFRKNGKIEQGLFFGYFLVLVFGGRILIEFLKEDQEAFQLGLGLNMGQLLSIPFVLAGVFFIVRAFRLGYHAEPDFPPIPVKEEKKKA